MGRPKRTNRRQEVYKKRFLSRKAKTRKIKIVSRKGQPQVIAKVQRLTKQDIEGPVSSSWISDLAWDKKRKLALMRLLNGYFYEVHIPFRVFEEWFHAHSKGTFFNGNIKKIYTVVRLN